MPPSANEGRDGEGFFVYVVVSTAFGLEQNNVLQSCSLAKYLQVLHT